MEKSDEAQSTSSKHSLDVDYKSRKKQRCESLPSASNISEPCLLAKHPECVIPCMYGKCVVTLLNPDKRFLPENVSISEKSCVIDLRKCSSQELRNCARNVGQKRLQHVGVSCSEKASRFNKSQNSFQNYGQSYERNQRQDRRQSYEWNRGQYYDQRSNESIRNQYYNRRSNKWNCNQYYNQRSSEWNRNKCFNQGSDERVGRRCAEGSNCFNKSQDSFQNYNHGYNWRNQRLDYSQSYEFNHDQYNQRSNEWNRSQYYSQGSNEWNHRESSSSESLSREFQQPQFVHKLSFSNTSVRDNKKRKSKCVADRGSFSRSSKYDNCTPTSREPQILVRDGRSWFPNVTHSSYWNDKKDDGDRICKGDNIQQEKAEYATTLSQKPKGHTCSGAGTSAQCWKQYKEEKHSALMCSMLPLYKQLSTPKIKPLLEITDIKDTASILKKLAIVKQISYVQFSDVSHILNISFDVHLPNSGYKKSVSSLPNHRLVVTRVQDAIPSVDIIAQTVNNLADNVPLRFAVVDNGDVAFYSFDDVCLPTMVSMG